MRRWFNGLAGVAILIAGCLIDTSAWAHAIVFGLAGMNIGIFYARNHIE